MVDDTDFIGFNLPEDLKKKLSENPNILGFIERMIHPQPLKRDPRLKAMIDTLKSYTRSQEVVDKMSQFFDWYTENLAENQINEEAKLETIKAIGVVWLPLIVESLTDKEKEELPAKLAIAMNL